MKRNLLALAAILAAGSTHAAVLQYTTTLSGLAEAPPNASPGTGSALLTYDTAARTMTLSGSFAGLTGNTTASHIHGPTAVSGTGTAGVATTTPSFAGFPLGVTSGSFNILLDLTLSSSYNPSFVTANGGTTGSAEAALAAAIANGKAYLNIHSSTFPGGEIRGFLTLVPEPSSFAILGLGAAMLGIAGRRRATA